MWTVSYFPLMSHQGQFSWNKGLFRRALRRSDKSQLKGELISVLSVYSKQHK